MPEQNVGIERRKKLLSVVTGLLMAGAMILTAEQINTVYTAGGAVAASEDVFTVVIDAGHGGDDPGKIGVGGELEKEINLEIARKVEAYLQAGDVNVVMTRTGDGGLYDPGASSKKVQDMKRRIEIMEEARPDVAVSIHQNSYTQEYVHGAQVFYYTSSEEGKELAELIQNQFVDHVDPENKRQIKANDSYYLLKKTEIPIVIVECGFLSNYAEAEKLSDEDYQDKVAWAIYMGIMQYLNK